MMQNIHDRIIKLEKQLPALNNTSQLFFSALQELGTLYLETGRHTEGLQCFLKRVEVKPESVDNHCSLGWAYLYLGEFNKALQSYNHACEISPDFIKAVSGQTDAYYRLGRLDDAYRNIQKLFAGRSVKKVDEAVAALRVYSKICSEYDQTDACIATIKQALSTSGLDKEKRLSLFYALASLLDKEGDYEGAFKYYTQANELSNQPYSQLAESQKNTALIEAFDSENLPPSLQNVDRSVQPLFILGMPRSGTSLIEQILSTHTDVSAAGELATLTEIANVLHGQCAYPKTLDKLTEHVLAQAAQHYFNAIAHFSNGKKSVTDKMPANYMHLGLIALLFPDATVIHANRNPIDVCLSIYFQRFPGTHSYSTNLVNIAQYYLEYHRLMQHWQRVLPIKIHNIYYEELVSDQERVTRTLLDKCQLDWQPDCLNFHHSSRVVTTASQDQVKQKMYKTSVNRWRNYEKMLPRKFSMLMREQQDRYHEELAAIKR